MSKQNKSYPKMPNYGHLAELITLYTQLKHEYGTEGIEPILAKAEKALRSVLEEIKALPIDEELAKQEPNDLAQIQKLRPEGPRRIWNKLDEAKYKERLEGALFGRFAGCTLGAPVEFWSIRQMELLAKENGTDFPPTDYWIYVPDPLSTRYEVSPRSVYTRDQMNGVPVDDDVTYTLLGLLVVEDFGPDFSVEDIGKAWVKYLPYACTAEDVALRNLRAGVVARQAAETNNPYCEWIGADIRSDPWGYMAPAWPQKAAEMAYNDAYISHRRQGIYGEMYFSAVISAAFAVDDPVEALKIGLTEIPRDCALAKAVKWAFEVAPEIKNYRQARDAMEKQFKGMHPVHTINNACLTIWGITIGGTDFTKAIGETVAMGMDNDCTGATVGSIVGAVVGKNGIPEYWYKNFNDTVRSYLIGNPSFSLSDLVKRFTNQASKIHSL